MRDHIAPALERCKIPHIFFSGCDLSAESAQLLANAVERNTEMSAFTCEGNRIDNTKTNKIMKEAIINTKAPIIMWNWNLLPQDVMKAIKLRAATSSNVTVDNVPSAKKLASVNEALSKGRMKASQLQAMLDEDNKENDKQIEVRRNGNYGWENIEDGLHRLRQFVALHQRIKDTELALEHTHAVNLKNEKMLQSVDDFKARVAHLFPAPFICCLQQEESPNSREKRKRVSRKKVILECAICKLFVFLLLISLYKGRFAVRCGKLRSPCKHRLVTATVQSSALPKIQPLCHRFLQLLCIPMRLPRLPARNN